MDRIQNYGGTEFADREVGDLRRESTVKMHKTGREWWTTSKANLILVPIFSIMDGMVLYSIFDACMTQSVVMGIIMAFGVAVVLNVLPLIIAKFAHQVIYKIKRKAIIMLIISLSGFILLFAGTVILRFAYSDMYQTESQSVQLENEVANDIDDDEKSEYNAAASNKSIAVVVLLSLSPLVTSIIGFAVAYVSDDELRKRIEYYELRDVEIDEAISDLEAAIETMNNDIERDLELDEDAMNAAIQNIIARGETLKAMARFYLAEYLANPKATSKLSEEMLVGNIDESEQVSVEPESPLEKKETINQVA